MDSVDGGKRSAPVGLVALVGRPNVGKSTLFNRLTRSRAALVDATPGLTRDRHYGVVQWQERVVRVVDTGGFEPDSGEPVTALMRDQTLVAVEEADMVLFVTDARTGPLADDWVIAKLLRRAGKRVVCVVNKAEGNAARDALLEFYPMGLQPMVAVSAAHGLGMDNLISLLISSQELAPEAESLVDEGIRVAVVGCPNSGKSTLINRLVGEERLVVSEQAGTTRDTIDLALKDDKGQLFTLMDTAGIRRKSRISLRIEKFSVIAAFKAMDRAEVAILVLDTERGITDQDRRVANLAVDAGCGLVFAVNKWDLAAKGRGPRRVFEQALADAFPQLSHAPVLFLSARGGEGVSPLLPTVSRVWRAGQQRIGTGPLNRWLATTLERHPLPRRAGRLVKIRYVTQVTSHPPTLLFFANLPDQVHETYRRYLENQLRDQFKLAGVSVRMVFRKSENPYDGPNA